MPRAVSRSTRLPKLDLRSLPIAFCSASAGWSIQQEAMTMATYGKQRRRGRTLPAALAVFQDDCESPSETFASDLIADEFIQLSCQPNTAALFHLKLTNLYSQQPLHSPSPPTTNSIPILLLTLLLLCQCRRFRRTIVTAL